MVSQPVRFPRPEEGLMLPTLLTAGLLLAASGHQSVTNHDARAFPTFVLIRGGELAEPVLIHHGALHLPGHPGDISCSPLATLMLSQDGAGAGDVTPGSVVYEVAEFWGQRALADQTGRPHLPLRWDGASQYSEIHVTSAGTVRWHTHEGAFRAARVAVQRLHPSAIKVLVDAGVVLPSSALPPAGVTSIPSACRAKGE
jgi:hypothetical protein